MIGTWRLYKSNTAPKRCPLVLLETLLQFRGLYGAVVAEKVGEMCVQLSHQIRDRQIALERELEEGRTKFAHLLDDYQQAARKISKLELQLRRYERQQSSPTRESMLHELMILGGRLKYAAARDLGIGEGIDQWLNYVRGDTRQGT